MVWMNIMLEFPANDVVFEMVSLQEIQNICLRRGIIFPTAEIYRSVAGFFDYGPIGASIKRKLIKYWREFFIKPLDILEIDGCTILAENVFKASGHLESFIDPITQCKRCNAIHRADDLIEEKTGLHVEGKSTEELTRIINERKIKCPKCGGELGEVKVFNLMLKTQISPVGDQIGYLRPETAQNIFTAFSRIIKTYRCSLPLGIAQVGRVYRNEISPRRFLIRLREFNQCEIEMFFDPQNPMCPIEEIENVKIPLVTREAQLKDGGTIEVKIKEALKEKIIPTPWLAYFMVREFEFYQSLGIPREALRFRHMLPEETPHYSAGNFDLEIKFDFGWKEVVGNAYRTDHDLKRHAKYSGVDLGVVVNNKKIVPHVVEPSFGIERTILAILLHTYQPSTEKRDWSWFKLPPYIAPYHVAVFPLVKKEEMVEKAKEIFKTLKRDFDAIYDEKDSIGKRYAKADEIGVPFCITIDGQTLKDDTVTIRFRDTTEQERVEIEKLKETIMKLMKR